MLLPEFVSFGPAVDAIANHPAKMATLLLFAEQAGEAMNMSQLAKNFAEMQGDEPGWRLTRGSRGTIFSYCERGIAPGLLDETEAPSQRTQGTVRAFRINDQGLATGVPLSGAGLGWELDNASASTQHLLGGAPNLRLSVYEQLLAKPGGMSGAQLRRAIGDTAGRTIWLLPNLRDAGILDIFERYTPAHRNLTLHSPDFSNLHKGGPRVHPETHAIFETASDLVHKRQTNMTGQDFLNEVAARYPQYDAVAVWRRISIAHASNKMRFIELAPFAADDEKQQTNAVITEACLEPVTALVALVKRLETDATYRSAMTGQAKELIRDSAVMAELMAKAYTSSAFTEPASRDAWCRLVIEHLPGKGSIDIRALYDRICPQVSYMQFRNIVSGLNGQGFEITWAEKRNRVQRALARVSLMLPQEYSEAE
ncbi:MAG TPA: hypothetical protein VLI54_04985 [Bacillota bacterium]|nr:hypothetical protein [Bacillota bacterium]